MSKRKKLAPIVLFVYARLEHTKKTIEALQKDKLFNESELWVFSDGYKNDIDQEKVLAVRNYLKAKIKNDNLKNVHLIESNKNNGLANSVISGVTSIISKYGKIIVLEDDLIISPNFLEYMNETLEFYKDDDKIWSISGYNINFENKYNYEYDIYLNYRGCSWGWGTWKNRWELVDWEVKDYRKFKNNHTLRKKFNRGGPDMSQMLDLQMAGEIDSWAIRWCYSQFKNEMYTIYPVDSLIFNCGLDGSGTHSGITDKFNTNLNNKKVILVGDLKLNEKLLREFYKKFDKGLVQKIFEFLTIIGLGKIVIIVKKMRKKMKKIRKKGCKNG